MSTLRAWVSAGESGPVITLSGETNLATVAELSELVTTQLSGGTVHLTIDAAGLSFADSASVRVLALAATTLHKRGGGLVLLRPRRAVARMLEIMGASELITVRGETRPGPSPSPEHARLAGCRGRPCISPQNPGRSSLSAEQMIVCWPAGGLMSGHAGEEPAPHPEQEEAVLLRRAVEVAGLVAATEDKIAATLEQVAQHRSPPDAERLRAIARDARDYAARERSRAASYRMRTSATR